VQLFHEDKPENLRQSGRYRNSGGVFFSLKVLVHGPSMGGPAKKCEIGYRNPKTHILKKLTYIINARIQEKKCRDCAAAIAAQWLSPLSLHPHAEET
jgi:hypothetical protein